MGDGLTKKKVAVVFRATCCGSCPEAPSFFRAAAGGCRRSASDVVAVRTWNVRPAPPTLQQVVFFSFSPSESPFCFPGVNGTRTERNRSKSLQVATE